MKQWLNKLLAIGILALGMKMTALGMELSTEEKSHNISLDTIHSINELTKSSSSDELSDGVDLDLQDDTQSTTTQDITNSAKNSTADQAKNTQDKKTVKEVDKKAVDYLPEATNDYCTV